jgi:hypothetical protein
MRCGSNIKSVINIIILGKNSDIECKDIGIIHKIRAKFECNKIILTNQFIRRSFSFKERRLIC